jgi:hypothetical protein
MLLIAATVLLTLGPNRAATTGWPIALPADSVVTLQGVLQVAEFFGPPNYGENPRSDRLEKTFVLQLPAPPAEESGGFALPPDTDSSAVNQYFYYIQLVVFTKDQQAAAALIGHRVRVTGTLMAAITGHHRTPVLLEVASITGIADYDW